jgi:hypothetical protein
MDSRSFKNRLTDDDRYHMLARPLLILEGWTGAIRGNTALDVNRVGVLFQLIVRGIHEFNITASEECEFETLPLSAFLNRRIGIEQFENLRRG